MENINLTPQRAKRNLNKSFNATPNSQCETPVLNYSIVENSVENDNIKLKLKLSNTQLQPQVILKSIDQNRLGKFNAVNGTDSDEIIDVDMEIATSISSDSDDIINIDDVENNMHSSRYSLRHRTPLPEKRPQQNLRRSTRALTKVSYNEYLSPRKTRLRSFDREDINVTPNKKLNNGKKQYNKALWDIDSPSKLGFENVSISSPTVKRNTVNKRTLQQNHTETNCTPKKHDKCINHEEFNSPRVPVQMKTQVQGIRELPSLDSPKRNEKVKRIMEDSSKSNTPRRMSNIKLIRNGDITPKMHKRQDKVINPSTPLNFAKEKLHVSYVPKALPCREIEYSDIYNFIEGKLLDGCGGCMYISGVPGTGKTATLTEVISQLQTKSKKSKIPKFTYVSINGMRLTEPRQAYVEILKQLTGKIVSWEQAQSTLDTKFTKAKVQKKDEPIVLLVDELDIICTKRQDVVYNLLDWPSKAISTLIVITIANTMDLPERLLMGRVTSRLGLTRLTFQAYTHKQLQEIVMKRLLGTNAFNPDAVQLVARKVASVSGDARRALDICRRAAEFAEIEGPNTLVSMQHVNDALNSMITQPKVRAIKRCSRLEQLILQAIAAEVERTGVDETTFSDVYRMLLSVCGIDGFSMISITVALGAVKQLSACRLLLTDQKSNDLNQRLILNVNADDIYYALRKDA